MSTPIKPAASAPQERCERALTQVTRALAGIKDLEVTFGAPGPGFGDTVIRLPAVVLPLSPADAARIRGHADHMALRRAYHDASTHQRFRPSGSRAREIYDAVEDMRCQALGANALAGVARNLTAALDGRADAQGTGRGVPECAHGAGARVAGP